MKPSIFMRVLLCKNKIYCPSFICFCKPSAAAHHLYNPGPLKLENTPHVPSTIVSVAADAFSDESSGSGESTDVKEATSDGSARNALKSCITSKVPGEPGGAPKKKKVQWVDSLGKELVQIKEFESRYPRNPFKNFITRVYSDRNLQLYTPYTGDTDNEQENRGCVCTIL